MSQFLVNCVRNGQQIVEYFVLNADLVLGDITRRIRCLWRYH